MPPWMRPTEVQLRKLEPGQTSQLMAHAADPRTMLALARDVFGHAPEAWWLTIPAVKLGFGDDLSPVARRGFHEQAVQEIGKIFAVRNAKVANLAEPIAASLTYL